jgi:hypothetical protein
MNGPKKPGRSTKPSLPLSRSESGSFRRYLETATGAPSARAGAMDSPWAFALI